MGEVMKVEIVSKEIIKPSSPTPPNLKTYNLSIFDQLSPNVYVSILLLYPEISGKDHEKIDNISNSLKSSLSNTLTQFYPFAGKIANDSDDASIECNDEGAIFMEARVHGAMALVLEKYSDFSVRKKFLFGGNEIDRKDHLLVVQANFFECGGLVIGMSMSHKLADVFTLGTFIKAWSATSLNSDDYVLDFSLPSIFPASTVPVSLPPIDFSLRTNNNLVAKRYVFDKSKMSLLKEKAKSEGVKEPSRVECVSSLLWKCLMAHSRTRVPSVFNQAVNLRTRITPPLPSNSIGNLVLPSIGSTDHDQTIKTNLSDLIISMRRGLHDLNTTTQKGLKTEEIISYFSTIAKKVAEPNKGYDSYSCSSWCRFPFYEADFGWGKPTWVCPCMGLVLENIFLLVDTRDGVGIEVWCTLSEQIIALLEQDEEFLTFAAV